MKNLIERGIKRIEKALGPALCSDSNPCGAVVQYNEGEAKAWRIADDHASEEFALLDSALTAAEKWASHYSK
jgi:hypothetical protein